MRLQPDTTDEKNDLNEVINFLRQELEAGRVKFTPGLRVVDDIMKVRYGTDGKVDPSSVEPSVRALAYGLAGVGNQEQMMQVPLIEAQEAYFDLLDRYFSKAYSEMMKHNVTSHQIAKGMSKTESLTKAFADDFDEIKAGVEGFWTLYGPIVAAHLASSQALKAVYGGDLSPFGGANVVASSAVYVDTVVLPDPVLKVVSSLGMMSPENLVYYVTKHALNVMRYREFVLADIDPPLVVIAAEQWLLDTDVADELFAAGNVDLLEHCSRMFGRDFDSQEELTSFFQGIGSPDDLMLVLAKPELLLFDTEWDGSVPDQLERFRRRFVGDFAPAIDSDVLGELVHRSLIGRMMQSNDILGQSSLLGGSPLVEAPTSWQYLLWKLQYDQKRSLEVDPELMATFVNKAVTVAGRDKFPLIAELPPKALIELRRKGMMEQLREVIRSGVEDVDEADEEGFVDTVGQVVANLEAALAAHQEDIADLKSSAKKFIGFDVVPTIGSGAVAVAAVSTGNLALAYAALGFGIAGASSVRDLLGRGVDLKKKLSETRRSPMSIFLKHS